jgi:ribonuclease P protein component
MTAPAGAAKLVMLKRRSEFLRIRNGLRWSTAAFVIEAKSRDGWASPVPIAAHAARFGLTVTKQLGGAVQRNRIRRRLRSALQQTAGRHAKLGFDYVVIARAPAETRPFDSLVDDLGAAFERIHSRPPSPKREKTGRKVK